MTRFALVFISIASYSQTVDWITQVTNKPVLDVRTFIVGSTTDLTTAINNCIAQLTNGGTCSLEGLTGTTWSVSSTINIPANVSLKIGVMKITAANTLNTCMFNLNGDKAEIFGVGNSSWLYVDLDNLNINTICGRANDLRVHDLRVTGPPHWYDESHLNLGNSVYLGCTPFTGECANGTRFKRARVYRTLIESGQNGVVLANIDGGFVYDNSFEVADRTGSSAICSGAFCDSKGLSDILFAGCRSCIAQQNHFADAMDWRMGNAGYDRPSQSAGTYSDIGHNLWIANQVLKSVVSEVLNSVMPYTMYTNNEIRSPYAFAGLGFYGANGHTPEYSSARGNTVEISNGPTDYYCGLLGQQNTSGDIQGMVFDGNTCVMGDRGFIISGQVAGTITGAVISNNKIQATDPEGAVLIAGTSPRNTVVSNNVITGSGIQVATGPSGTRVIGNDIRNASNHCIVFQDNGTPINGGVIEGNTIDGCAQKGIALSGQTNSIVVQGNTILSAAGGAYLAQPSQLLYTPTLDVLRTASTCTSSSSPAGCVAAAAGSIAIPVGVTSLVVNTTSVTAGSQIMVSPDSSLSTRLGVTCNTTPANVGFISVTGRNPGISFTISVTGVVSSNPACLSYVIVN